MYVCRILSGCRGWARTTRAATAGTGTAICPLPSCLRPAAQAFFSGGGIQLSPFNGHHQHHHSRFLSSSTAAATPISASTSTTTTTTAASTEEEPEVVLFERKTNPSMRLMRSGLALSTFHTGYWIWYITDFVPMVNQAGMQELHIDPAVGYGGLFFALILNAAFAVYPKRLVSKLSYRPQSQKIVVYTHRLPIVRPDPYPSASFPVGGGGGDTKTNTATKENTQSPRKYFQLNDYSMKEIQTLAKTRAFVELGHDYTGILSAGTRQPLYSISIQGKADVPEPELLLEALMRPETFGNDFLNSDHHDASFYENSSTVRRLRSQPRRRRTKATRRIQKRRPR